MSQITVASSPFSMESEDVLLHISFDDAPSTFDEPSFAVTSTIKPSSSRPRPHSATPKSFASRQPLYRPKSRPLSAPLRPPASAPFVFATTAPFSPATATATSSAHDSQDHHSQHQRRQLSRPRSAVQPSTSWSPAPGASRYVVGESKRPASSPLVRGVGGHKQRPQEGGGKGMGTLAGAGMLSPGSPQTTREDGRKSAERSTDRRLRQAQHFANEWGAAAGSMSHTGAGLERYDQHQHHRQHQQQENEQPQQHHFLNRGAQRDLLSLPQPHSSAPPPNSITYHHHPSDFPPSSRRSDLLRLTSSQVLACSYAAALHLTFAYDAAFPHPPSSQNLSLRGAAYLGLRDFPSALSACASAIELDPDLYTAVYWKAIAHHALGDYVTAARLCSKVLSACPLHRASLSLRCDCNRRAGGGSGAWSKVYADADALVKRWPEDADAWTARGEACMQLGMREEAERSCGKAIEIDPNRARLAYQIRGEARYQLHKYKLCIGDFHSFQLMERARLGVVPGLPAYAIWNHARYSSR